jgi:hypothetical protein
MLRAAAAALLLCAVLVAGAGCGGTSVRSAALEMARSFGAKNARVIRVERVHMATGYDHDVVLVRGRFCRGGNGFSTQSSKGRCVDTLAQFTLTPGAHAFAGSVMGIPIGEPAQIAAGRKASPLLRVFPDVSNMIVTCRIPPALLPGSAQGTCYSEPERGAVAFIAHWPLSSPPGTRHVGGWIVRLAADGRVTGMTIHRHGPLLAWLPTTSR